MCTDGSVSNRGVWHIRKRPPHCPLDGTEAVIGYGGETMPKGTDQQDRLREIPMSKLKYNPGMPVPSLGHTATRLNELWPLKGVIANSLENLGLKNGGGGRCRGTSEADTVKVRTRAMGMRGPDTERKINLIQVGELIAKMIIQGTSTGTWKNEAAILRQVMRDAPVDERKIWAHRVNPLDTFEGTAVYWLWVAEEFVSIDEIVQLVCQAVMRDRDDEGNAVLSYHPYVLQVERSEKMATSVMSEIMDLEVCVRGQRRLEQALGR